MLNNSNTGFQNNLIYKSMNMQQKMQDRKVFEQFMSKPVIERVTADRPRGYLIKENPLQQFGSMFKDTAQDVKNLGNALTTGKSNDFELGRMNDLGMKLGGALVAGALMGSRQTTNKKLMEFLGFGTFFSVMSLWPKLAIDLPTKLLHGFNPHQKYEDSQGRKKQFFQDNQYLPWDVWSKDEINKVADKMGVDKNLQDREEYTKEKMRTIALQDNTLWMLTAGFATPLLTSLACNRIEEGLRVPIAQAQLRRMGSELQPDSNAMKAAFEKVMSSPDLFRRNDDNFRTLMNQLKEGTIPENFAEKLGSIFDLTALCSNGEVKGAVKRNGTDYAQELISRLFPTNQGMSDDFIRMFTGNDDEAFGEARAFLDKAFNTVISRPENKGNIPTFDNVLEAAIEDLDAHAGKKWAEDLYGLYEGYASGDTSISKNLQTFASRSCDKRTMTRGASELEKIYTQGVKPAQASFKLFGNKLSDLGNISGECYNKTAREFINILGFTPKEIKELRNLNNSFGGMVEENGLPVMKKCFEREVSSKIQEIGQDKNKLDKAMARIEKVEQQFSRARAKNGTESSIKGIFKGLVDNVNNMLKDSADRVTDSSAFEGSKLQQQLRAGLSDHEELSSRASITSVESVITKLKAALRLEEAIQNDTLYENWENYVKAHNLPTESLEELLAGEKERFYSQCRKIAWESNYADAVNKFYLDGNGDFFKAITDVVFGGDLTDESINAWKAQAKAITQEADIIPFPLLKFKPSTTIEEVVEDITTAYRKQNKLKPEDTLSDEIIQLIKQRAKDYIDNQGNIGSLTHKTRFAQFGESALRTCEKQIRGIYNDQTWMKTFGRLAVGLVGITLISQLFFGKVKDSHLYNKQDKNNNNTQDTFVSGRK